MSYFFNEKGKYFTEVVPKDSLAVLVQCQNSRVQGHIFLRPGERLKDALNMGDQFIAVSEAGVFDCQGALLYRSKFMVLNRSSIDWIIPLDDLQGDETQPESQP